MNALARTALTGLLLLAAQPGVAQTGPAHPRIVDSAVPLDGPRPAPGEMGEVEVTLSLDADGRVMQVEIRRPFGDARFIDEVRRNYGRLRFIPALNARGTPIASSIESKYVVKEDPFLPRAIFPPGGSTFPLENPSRKHDFGASRGASTTLGAHDEAERVKRMTCRDFLWEYDLMKETVATNGGQVPEYERPMSVAQWLYSYKYQLVGKQLQWLMSNHPRVIDASVAKCRVNLSGKYWADVVEPTIKSMLSK
jgi:hypothetical protein